MPAEFISSESNHRIKLIKALRDRKKTRYAERLFIVEGPRFVDDALVYSAPVLLVLSDTRESAGEYEETGIPTIVVPDVLFAHVSDTLNPQGVLALFPLPEPVERTDITPLVVVADGIQDPGNLGTLIRSAAAFGATKVLCVRGTVDPFSPKVTRAAAVALFQIPVETGVDLPGSLAELAVYAAESAALTPVRDVDWSAPSAIIIGNEGNGIQTDIAELGAIPVAIPLARPVESLNAGVAASVVLYEASRQRSAGPD